MQKKPYKRQQEGKVDPALVLQVFEGKHGDTAGESGEQIVTLVQGTTTGHGCKMACADLTEPYTATRPCVSLNTEKEFIPGFAPD